MMQINNRMAKAVIGASALLLVLAVDRPSAAAESGPALAAPAGITFVRERRGGRRAAQFSIRFGDAQGMKVYARIDPSAPCAQECTEGWSPFVASPGVAAFGEWTIVTHASGAKQWAYKGEPLFIRAGDPSYEDTSDEADDAKVAETFDAIVASIKDELKPKDQKAKKSDEDEASAPPLVDLKKWKLAVYEPPAMTAPPGLSVSQISNAFGEGLVDRDGMTVYLYRGKDTKGKGATTCEGPCPELWTPVRAPARASRVGEFTVVAAADGSSQWALRGLPLYTYAKDLVPGHANGAGANWQMALTTRYFTPPGVQVTTTPIAEVLSVNGQALYTRNPFIYQLGGHNIRDGLPGGYGVGKKQGLRGCDAACLKEWRPFVAAPDAKPSGFWQIAVRPDGTRQWEYKGYVLYTYAGDVNPGDINGNDIYDLVDGEAPGRYSAVEAGGAMGAALFWHVATP